MSSNRIELERDCEVVEVPGGRTVQLTKGTPVSITQALGGSYTLLVPALGGLYRLAGRDADAIGREPAPAPADSAESAPRTAEELRDQVWAQLKTCFDPEIPVNIVDLGLIYELDLKPHPEGDGHQVDVKMTLTAQGCGMGDSIAADARHKIEGLPGVRAADVQIVWEPIWTPERISPEGKQLLGIS